MRFIVPIFLVKLVEIQCRRNCVTSQSVEASQLVRSAKGRNCADFQSIQIMFCFQSMERVRLCFGVKKCVKDRGSGREKVLNILETMQQGEQGNRGQKLCHQQVSHGHAFRIEFVASNQVRNHEPSHTHIWGVRVFIICRTLLWRLCELAELNELTWELCLSLKFQNILSLCSSHRICISACVRLLRSVRYTVIVMSRNEKAGRKIWHTQLTFT